MTLGEAIGELPYWVRVWVGILSVVVMAVPVILLIWRETRVMGIVILAANVVMSLTMQALYGEAGFVRLLGLPHLVFWTPLLVWAVLRLRRGIAAPVPRVAIGVFAAVVAVSLAFDTVDVARWLLGERAPIVGPLEH
ncbi:MAG: hypothetical protein AAFW69_05390 [Pseudomonadota bacterium]